MLIYLSDGGLKGEMSKRFIARIYSILFLKISVDLILVTSNPSTLV